MEKNLFILEDGIDFLLGRMTQDIECHSWAFPKSGFCN